LQSKLLRVIQEMQVIHVGGNRVIDLDVRVIAATNQDLWTLVQQQKFREDLYYRLNVLEITLPPLRDRKEDIYPLFLQFVAQQSPQAVGPLERISSQLRQTLNSYSWPGNIRELENFSKAICVTCDMEQPPQQICQQIEEEMAQRIQKLARQPLQKLSAPVPLIRPRLPDDEGQIREALAAAGGNCTKAAELLGVSRVTLWRRMKQFSSAGEK